MSYFFTAILTLVTLTTFAQKQTFDIITYACPNGWKQQVKEGLTELSFTDSKDRTWCQVGIYKSTSSKGSASEDFTSEWRAIAATLYNISEPPQTTDELEADGWKIKSGTGKFIFNNKPAAAMLTIFSGYGKCVSILATTGNQRYLQEIENIIASVELQKPSAAEVQTNSATPDGDALSTTRFDDDWTSSIQTDWVLITKAGTSVYLCYALPFNASDFSGTGVMERDYYWDNCVSKYFNIQSKQYRDDGEVISGLKPKYGWATDKQTGEKRFIEMVLSIAPNTAYVTIASATDEAILRQQFPHANDKYTSDLAAMSRYNKFAVDATAIIGEWQKGNTSTAQWYYVTPSGYEGYAGMTFAATTATFNFNKGGSYSSTHNGATGSVGNMSTFQQHYKGTYTVSNWLITATNRWKGKTDQFEALSWPSGVERFYG